MYLIKFLKLSTQKQTTKLLAQGLLLGLSRMSRYHTYNSKAVKACHSGAVARDVGSHGFHGSNVKLPGLCGKNLSWQGHLPRCQTLNPAVLLPEPKPGPAMTFLPRTTDLTCSARSESFCFPSLRRPGPQMLVV